MSLDELTYRFVSKKKEWNVGMVSSCEPECRPHIFFTALRFE